ncbi:MAG: hypothetical protein V2A73_17210 [Pseudomonadota bacterium]
MEYNKSLDYFGRFIMRKLRDRGIVSIDGLLRGKWKAPALIELQRELNELSPRQKAIVRRAFLESLDTAVHDFLFAVQEESDRQGRLRVLVDDQNVAASSDGLHGELFGGDGWMARHSEFGEPPE